MNIEARGSVASIGRGSVSIGRNIGVGRSIVEGPARINLAGFRPMTIGDIGKPDLGGTTRPLGWAVTPRSFEIHNQVRLERYATIRENARVAKPMVSIMAQVEGIAAKTWKATEPSVAPKRVYLESLNHWNEVRNQPDITPEILERAHRAKADLLKRKIAAMPNPEPQAQASASPKNGTEAYAKTASKFKTEVKEVVKQEVKIKQEKKKTVETPKVRKPKKGTIIFKKDEPVSAYRLARAKEKFKDLNKERNGGVVRGEELNSRLGLEIQAERSRLLEQLGFKDSEDGSNIKGFRKVLGRLVFNDREDGLKKIHEANEKYDPVKIGGDGKVESEEAVEIVLQGRLVKPA